MNYMIYGKHEDGKRFGPMNLAEGRVGVGLVFATLIPDLERAKGYADTLTEKSPDFLFQVRVAGKAKVVYTLEARKRRIKMKYFEIKFSDGICIYCQGRRVPSLENATDFCQIHEMADGTKVRLYAKLVHVVEVSKADALKYGKCHPEFPVYEPSLHDAGYDSDKFRLHPDGRIHWIYWNPNGYGEKGQFVEHCLHADNIREVGITRDGDGNYDAGTFFEQLNDYGKQYLWDNDGSDDFAGFEEEFFDDSTFHLIDCTDETMLKLVEFAACEDNDSRTKMISARLTV